jgi:hypothetical protein
MKTALLYLSLAILVVGCKKDNKNQALDITGSWVLATTSFNNGPAYSTVEYFCLRNNNLVINSNGTAMQNYTGTEACMVGTGIYAGQPGDTTRLAWTRNLNNIHFKYTANGVTVNSYGAVSSSNTQPQLILTDTVEISGAKQTTTETYVRD